MTELFFWAKKFLTWSLYPLSIVIVLQGAALLLGFFTRRKKLAFGLFLFSFVILVISSFPFVPRYELSRLEHAFPVLGWREEIVRKFPHQAEAARFIVVLGGGATPDPARPYFNQVPTTVLLRLLEAVRLHHYFPQTKVVLSGGAVLGRDPEADTMREVALALGLPDDCLVLERVAKDTDDQSRLLRPIVGEADFFLVTSAYHMARSMQLFQQRGFHPIPAPVDFTMRRPGEGTFDFPWVPFGENLVRCERFIKEHLGMWWSRWRG